VKNPTQAALMRLVSESEMLMKPVVVTGCVPQGDKKINELQKVSMLGVTQIDRVVEVVEETLNGNVVHLLEKKALPTLDLPKIRKNRFIEIIPINTGCLGNCTYCKTKHARGHLGSYDKKEIINRMLKAYQEGVREIWMTSEDTGAYGLDIGTNISELLIEFVEAMPDDLMLRIGMTNPPYILEHLPVIASVLNHPRVFGFLHVPVQSGSDTVLERMNREYSCKDFETVCAYLMEHCPALTIGTDIICGFPGETDAEHQDTLDLLSKFNIPIVNISQFYPRPGTIAARMKQLDTKSKPPCLLT
jgi:threonylcarbamoyladenosine tRNA methylthiotransferase CDKAL1